MVEGIEVSPESSCEYDPSSNGSAECGVQIAKGKIRAIRSCLAEKLGQPIPDNSPLITWICLYAGAMQRRFSIGDDGRTPWERLHGRKCAQPMAVFGERIWWMPLDKDASIPDPGTRFCDGFWAGPVDGQNESYVLT